ncbi:MULTISPECIES: ComEC/Rec2 family competence protein [Pseudomonas]|uniref:Competence protein ComEC n=1 Tax=Pseudomonas lactis TaxID=1615674 RepID=A0ABS9FS70_9PSED|nr:MULTISPECIES: competence protein ComEC [Pseudomonas]MBH8755547.1 competence protein ComEC [Pseudomonas aeruginosa]MCF4973023.1 competence protein ComEC [Pseudomonas lactis]MCF5003702.1 competence protein ComEC [Pseudomonas lactis]MCF5006767.1 competence protein ComEC [Pseudomonas lactis]MCF5013171.1 competence protein ComEC [Pseudomonas lactis]
MADYFEIDFLGVETAKSGDAITLRYSVNGTEGIHVVDGGYLDTGDQIVEHLKTYYGTTVIDHVILTHPDRDHANGLRKVLEQCSVRNLWINRPWIYAEQLIDRFEAYESVEALRRKLRSVYDATAALEDIAVEKGIPIHAPLQGQSIGPFTVMAPTLGRYMDLIVDSTKTPEAVEEGAMDSALSSIFRAVKAATSYIKSLWGDEYFPSAPTSRENEMSVVQSAVLNGHRVMLTGDAGREALQEVIDYAPFAGFTLPGIRYFQVPHHGGRHNVSTEILDQLVGPRLDSMPDKHTWNAICSSAKADEDHPRKSVIRAVLHRGGHWAATESQNIRIGAGITRDGWVSIPQAAYPEEQES